MISALLVYNATDNYYCASGNAHSTGNIFVSALGYVIARLIKIIINVSLICTINEISMILSYHIISNRLVIIIFHIYLQLHCSVKNKINNVHVYRYVAKSRYRSRRYYLI